MEIEGTDGSKTLLKPGSTGEFGRGLGFTSDDRTVSRRQISFQTHNPPDHEDETKVSFEVVGRNPIWVYSNQDGEVRTFTKFERGEMENGDMFCVSASKPIWFTLKRIDLDDEDKRGAEKELEMETQLAETLQSSSCPVGIGLDVENIDISGIDPVQGLIISPYLFLCLCYFDTQLIFQLLHLYHDFKILKKSIQLTTVNPKFTWLNCMDHLSPFCSIDLVGVLVVI